MGDCGGMVESQIQCIASAEKTCYFLKQPFTGQTNFLYRTCVVNIVDNGDDGLSNGEVAASVSVPLIVIIIIVIVVAVMVVKKRIAFSITSGNQPSNNGAHQDQPIR